MNTNDKDYEVFDTADELIEKKPTFAEGETWGEGVISTEDTETSNDSPEPADAKFEEFNEAEELLEQRPTFAAGETYGEIPLRDEDEFDTKGLKAPKDDPEFHQLGKRNDHDDA